MFRAAAAAAAAVAAAAVGVRLCLVPDGSLPARRPPCDTITSRPASFTRADNYKERTQTRLWHY